MPRADITLTQHAFARLLQWLDDGIDSRGERYLDMRQRLARYFDRRNRPLPDDLADETLNRIARTLTDDGTISVTPPARYCYVVARFVLLDDTRRREHTTVPLNGPRRLETPAPSPANPDPDGEPARSERQFDCLERCVETLAAAQRTLILDYYGDERHAKIAHCRALAERLGITLNALAVRACRIRDTLEACVEDCCGRR
jgi:DNA-directed RNA polymerase specialized sigma24 family protein